jgi:hypothetical protein
LTFAGFTTNNDHARELKTILTLSDPDCGCHAIPRSSERPLAIIAAYNEGDIIDEVIADWLAQGCDVHLVDNWSKDETWDIARRYALNRPARVTIERFPEAPGSTYEWLPLLERKAEIAARHPGRWIIHSDADEIRRSPFPGLNMADSLDLVAASGANRVDFRVINFRPTDGSRAAGASNVLAMRHFEFGTRAGHLQQSKAWLQGSRKVDLASTGGHEARFEGVNEFRYKFLLKHYPLRSEAHASRKIEQERNARRSSYEVNVLNYHRQYDDLPRGQLSSGPAAELMEWSEASWEDHGLMIMVDLLSSRVERGWMAAGR